MKCWKCGAENKDEAKFCKKCGSELVLKQVWKPGWKWHVKMLAIIYAALIAVFFLLNWWLSPYMRNLPKDATPWLSSDKEQPLPQATNKSK